MAKRGSKPKKAKSGQERKWKPSAFDAMNLAYLRYYAMEIEQTSISIYAGDDDDRTKFNALVVDLSDFLIMIRAKYKDKGAAKKDVPVLADQCFDSWVLCSGLCVPPDQCDR